MTHTITIPISDRPGPVQRFKLGWRGEQLRMHVVWGWQTGRPRAYMDRWDDESESWEPVESYLYPVVFHTLEESPEYLVVRFSADSIEPLEVC